MSFRFQLPPLVAALVISIFPPPLFAEVPVTSTTRQDFEWVDLNDCRRPKLKPPALPPEDYEEYNFQRRYLALEPGRPCIVMDSYIERIGGSSSPGMRTLGARKYRLERGKWVEARLAFSFFPYAIRRRQDGRVFYVEALLAEDLKDGSVGSHWYPMVSIAKQQVPAQGDLAGALAFDWISEAPAEVLQGLAVVLTQRLRTPAGKPSTQEILNREHKRIRQLLASAWETLPPQERVALDADGLPR